MQFVNMIFPSLVIFLLFASTLLPVFTAYLLCFGLLVWLILSKALIPQIKDYATLRNNGLNRKVAKHYYNMHPLLLGAFCFIGSTILASLASYLDHGGEYSAKLWLKPNTHNISKFLLVLIVITIGFHKLRVWQRLLERPVFKWVSIYLLIYFVYSLVQRYTGINLVHGLSAYLPENRQIDGLYRVSAFFGHPLTLAYNLTLLIPTLICFVQLAKNLISLNKLAVFLNLIFLLGILIFSSSRVPMLIGMFSLLLSIKFSKKMFYIAPVLIAGIALILYLEETTLKRFIELTSYQNIPRFKFWLVHLDIFSDFPIFGFGPSIPMDLLATYYSKINYYDKIYSAHNIYFQVLANYGLIGFLGFCAFLLGILFSIKRILSRSGNRCLLALMCPILIGGLTQNHFFDSEYLIALWVSINLLSIASVESEKHAEPNEEYHQNYRQGKN